MPDVRAYDTARDWRAVGLIRRGLVVSIIAEEARIVQEAARRRTFAIISHPDAGKTTLTEKLLLYADAIDLAGAVKAKKNQRAATSDWMELERQRGISIT